MTQIAEELDARMKSLAPAHARYLESLVWDALLRTEQLAAASTDGNWPPGYFERTAGVLADEDFDRPSQGELPRRDDW